MTGVGTNIAAIDYNNIQTSIANIYGQNVNGYGQILHSSQVSSSAAITAAQWNALQADITAVNQHQLNTDPVYNGSPLTTATNSIKIYENDRAAYLAVAQALANPTSTTVGGVTYPGCYVLAPTGQNTVGGSGFPIVSTRSSAWGNGSSATINHAVTLQFTNNAAADYFFNSGSAITFSALASGGTVSTSGTKDSSWATLLNNVSVSFSYSNVTGVKNGNPAGTGSIYGWNYFNANRGVPQLVFQNITGDSYAPNQYDITASLNANGTILTFTCQFKDLSAGAVDESVTATIASTINAAYASGAYVSMTTPNNYLPNPVTTIPLTS
jgi:hypothetical protein